jgi:serine/threonine-protein kinase
MTPERWRQVDRVLQEALELAPAERAAFLDEACGGDEELRQEVESLISFQERAERFIETPPGEMAADWLAVKESREGQMIGNYHLIRQIGRGGMGEVYLARDTRLERQVALKLLPPRFTEDAHRLQRFRQEARAASSLNHPNIITIHEIGEVATETGAAHFIATEYIEGHTLRDLIQEGGLKLSEALEVAIQAAGALSAAHEAGITHRDIKPENIMLRHDGYVKVLDFGLAKLNESLAASERFSEVETDPGIVLGTVSYMSPEQARGLDTDGRSDIFSFGVVFYEMLTTRRPFIGETPADVIASLLGQEPQPLATHNSDFPVELQSLIDQTLAKDRSKRFQTARELRRALKAVKKKLASADDFTTRAFSGVSLLGQRSRRAKTAEEYKTTTVEPARAPETSSLTILVSRFFRSPTRLTLTLVTLAVLIAGVMIVRHWRNDAARIDSIAVLPFKPVAADSRDEALEMGLTDTLITRLSNLKSVTVRPVSAVRRYAALDQDPIEAGRALKAQAVLDGSIQKLADRIGVTARLLNVSDGRLIWSRQFVEPWTDIFAVQDAIAQRVAEDLMAPLTGQERSELARNYTSDPVAYKLYLDGRHEWRKRTAEGMRKGINFFDQAIEKDPRYALAYVGKADAYATLASYRLAPPRDVAPLAKEAAAQALNIDDRLAEAHASMGKIMTDYDGDWEQSEKEFRLAIELKPKYSNAHHWYSTLLAHMGKFDEAVREANLAMELDYYSLVTRVQLGNVLYRARRYDQAIPVLQKTLELDPRNVTARFYLGLCYLMQEKPYEAISEFKKARTVLPENPDFIAIVGHSYGRAGRLDEARRCLRELNDVVKHHYVSPFDFVNVYSGLGDLDMAFKWLDKAYEDRDSTIRGLKTDPLFDLLRPDPRFTVLMRRAGLER